MRKFYQAVMAEWDITQIRQNICSVMRFYKGAVTYKELLAMPFSEMADLIDNANRIVREENNASK